MGIPTFYQRDVGGELGQALGGAIGNYFQNKQAQQLQQQSQQRELSSLQQAFAQMKANPELGIEPLLYASNISPERRKLAIQSLQNQGTLEQKRQPTPYQQDLLKQKQAHLDIQKKKLDSAREKGRKELPQMVSNFTKGYAKDIGISPEEKLELDKLVQDSYINQDLDLNTALQTGLDTLAQRKEAIESIRVPNRPFASDFRSEAKLQAMEQTADVLQQAYDSGITKPKDLKRIAERGGWKKEEIDEILNRISGGKIKSTSKKESPKPPQEITKVKFDSKNPEHVSRAKQALTEANGDRAEANRILAEEFSK